MKDQTLAVISDTRRPEPGQLTGWKFGRCQIHHHELIAIESVAGPVRWWRHVQLAGVMTRHDLERRR